MLDKSPSVSVSNRGKTLSARVCASSSPAIRVPNEILFIHFFIASDSPGNIVAPLLIMAIHGLSVWYAHTLGVNGRKFRYANGLQAQGSLGKVACMSSPSDLTAATNGLLAEARTRRQRRMLVICGSRETGIATAGQILEAGNLAAVHWFSDRAPRGVAASQGRAALGLLGTELDALVFDAWSGFDPDAFGALSGTLRGGGLLLLLTPVLDQWRDYPDPLNARITVAPCAPDQVSGHFLSRLARVLDADPGVMLIEDGCVRRLPVPASAVEPPKQDAVRPPYRTCDQQRAVEAVLHVVNGHRRRPVVLAAAFRRRGMAAIRLIRGPRLALIGPPNAGKSTLANRLIGTDRIITSPHAGTTRDWVSETAMIDGWPVTLTDTAGIRDVECQIEAEAVRRGRRRAEEADLVVIVLDGAATPGQLEKQWKDVAGAVPADRLRLTLLNKCDLSNARWETPIAARGGSHQGGTGTAEVPLPISARTGAGIDALESRVCFLLGLDQLADHLPTAFLPAHLTSLSPTAEDQ